MSQYRERPATGKERRGSGGMDPSPHSAQRPQSAHMGTLANKNKRPSTGVSRGARAASARAKVTPLQTYNIGEVVEVGRDPADSSSRSRPSTASTTQRFFKVSTHSEPRFSNVGLKFRSGALDLEVDLTEKLRRFSDDEKDPSLIAMRRKIFSDLFAEVIEKDDTYGSLLGRIKEEYDRGEGGGSGHGGGGGGASSAYVETNIEMQQMKRAHTKANNENVQLHQDMELLRKECEEYKYLVSQQKGEERSSDRKASSTPAASKQQALGNHISSLEANLQGASSQGHGAGWGEIDRLLSQKDEMEEKVITLTAELQLSRRREGDALAQLHDLRTQLQHTARSFTAITDIQSEGEYSDEDDDMYDPPTSTDPTSSASDNFVYDRAAPVPKLPL